MDQDAHNDIQWIKESIKYLLREISDLKYQILNALTGREPLKPRVEVVVLKGNFMDVNTYILNENDVSNLADEVIYMLELNNIYSYDLSNFFLDEEVVNNFKHDIKILVREDIFSVCNDIEFFKKDDNNKEEAMIKILAKFKNFPWKDDIEVCTFYYGK